MPVAVGSSPTRLTMKTTSVSLPIARQSTSSSTTVQPGWRLIGMRGVPALPLISRDAAMSAICSGSALTPSRATSTLSGSNRAGKPFDQTPAAVPGGKV